MDLAAFRRSLEAPEPPPDLPPALAALWALARGQWDQAHAVVQACDSADCHHVHAHLHRVEDDPDNAAFWYARAGVPAFWGDLAEEWESLVLRLLPQDPG